MASWTHYLNHSSRRPNLVMNKHFGEDGEPVVAFATTRAVAAGDELLFDYGPAYWDGAADEAIEDDTWDDPRIFGGSGR